MKIDEYIDFLLAYNEKVNLVSKKSNHETIKTLIFESLLLKRQLRSRPPERKY